MGIPLGVLADTDFQQGGPVTLDSGDIVLVGTDGIWEAHNPAGEMFGKQRFREIMATTTNRTAEQIHHAVVDAVKEFCASAPQEDDITLVVIKAL